MKHEKLCIGLAAPLALLLGLAPANAQQTAPSPDTTQANPSNETRQLENEIEDYPGPNDGLRDDAEPRTRIPEEVAPSPNPSAVSPRMSPPSSTRKSPQSAAPARPGSSARSDIDQSEVQRVFGSDARLIALSSLDASTVTRLQMRLHELGHYMGPVDGVVGPKTRAALEAFNRAQFALKQKLLTKDQMTVDSAEQLGIEPAMRSNAAPPPLPENRDMPDDTAPSLRRDAPLLPRGGAPLPPPGVPPLPTPSSAPAPAGGATPAPPPPSP